MLSHTERDLHDRITRLEEQLQRHQASGDYQEGFAMGARAALETGARVRVFVVSDLRAGRVHVITTDEDEAQQAADDLWNHYQHPGAAVLASGVVRLWVEAS